MDKQQRRFPAVERIDPILTVGTLGVGYVAVAEDGHYFNARHKHAIEQALRSKFKVSSLRMSSGTVLGRARLAVNIEPSDSLADRGTFVVLGTLQELLEPRVQHVAVTLLQSSLRARSGDLTIGMQVLGNPADDIVRSLETRIGDIPRTIAVERDMQEPRHFIITVAGTWDEAAQEYRKELIEQAGVSSTMLMNSRL